MSKPYALWTPDRAHPDPQTVPMLDEVRHVIVHRGGDDSWFLHGAAIAEHRGTLFCSWANSPVDENSTGEVLRCRRSTDGGHSWSEPETIGPGYPDDRNHSHCAFLAHGGTLLALAGSFRTLNTEQKVFPGLRTEIFALDDASGRWIAVGVGVEDFWPYEEPKRMSNGNWIMGGQNSDSNCIVAISRGEDVTQWDAVPIPRPDGAPLRFGETTTYVDRDEITAVIRYRAGLAPSIGEQVALVSGSSDHGSTWSEARASNLPAGDSKLYAGTLSDGRRYLVYNADTAERRSVLLVATGRPGEDFLSAVRRVQYGYPPEHRRDGFAKSKQWSYPYAFEFDGDLFIGYSVNKEDCCLSVIPLDRLD